MLVRLPILPRLLDQTPIDTVLTAVPLVESAAHNWAEMIVTDRTVANLSYEPMVRQFVRPTACNVETFASKSAGECRQEHEKELHQDESVQFALPEHRTSTLYWTHDAPKEQILGEA